MGVFSTHTVTVNSGGNLTLPGVISGLGLGFTKAGSGTLTLGTATGTFSGTAAINGGTLSIPSAAGLANTTGITIAGASAAAPSTLQYTGSGASTLPPTGNITLGTVDSANIIEVTSPTGMLQMGSSAIFMGGTAVGSTALIKIGPGLFGTQLNTGSSSSTMTGDTHILNGTIRATPTNAGTNQFPGPVHCFDDLRGRYKRQQ